MHKNNVWQDWESYFIKITRSHFFSGKELVTIINYRS